MTGTMARMSGLTNTVTDTRGYLGWHLAAFADDLTADVSPVDIGDQRLVAVRTGDDGDRMRVFDATCPHRGAHLGHGARISRGCLLCPFHGRRVHLGTEERGVYRVAEHESLQVGDALFVRLNSGPDHGFRAALTALSETHLIRAGFTRTIGVESSVVVENAFDPEHFAPVHGMSDIPAMDPQPGPDGELVVDSELRTRGRAMWQQSGDGAATFRFLARAYSPTLVVTQVGAEADAPFFLTGTAPATAPGSAAGCIARVAVAFRRPPDGRNPSPLYVAGLIAGSMKAFREDIPIWENLARDHLTSYDERDHVVHTFRDFVSRFPRTG